jgi:soluble lytic murein transglycosylase-like protein
MPDLSSFYTYLRRLLGGADEPASTVAPTPPIARYAPTEQRERLERLANNYQLPVALADSWVMKESSWKPTARGSSGEYGLTQLMPYLVEQYGIQKTPLDSEANLRAGMAHLSGLVKDYKGNVRRALAAYNVGRRGEREGRPRGNAYADAILELQRKKYGQ